MDEEIGRLKDTVKKLQKSIYTLNTVLRESLELRNALEEFERAHALLNEMLREDPELEGFLRTSVQDQDLLVVFKEMKARYDALLNLLRRYETVLSDAESMFEKYRNYRYYMFREDDDIVRFVDRLFGSSAKVRVKPLIVEKVDVNAWARSVGGETAGKFAIEVEGERAADAVKYLMSKHPSAGFVVEDGRKKCTWKPDVGIVRVECPKEDLLDVDRLAERLDAVILDV